jgi:hypothetical protein
MNELLTSDAPCIGAREVARSFARVSGDSTFEQLLESVLEPKEGRSA